jgi:hypothetical protein
MPRALPSGNGRLLLADGGGVRKKPKVYRLKLEGMERRSWSATQNYRQKVRLLCDF